MAIEKLRLENYKRFRSLELKFNKGMNILVGRNDEGKSTVMEVIHLALTGLLYGRPLRTELSQHLFNNEVVASYIESLKTLSPLPPPHILIELFLTDDFPILKGDDNSTKSAATGLYVKVAFDPDHNAPYETLVKAGDVQTLPIEYYAITWKSFARDGISTRTLPLKSALIDSSTARYQNGSDVYISRIVRDFLEDDDVVGISQAYRKMKENFRTNNSIAKINAKIKIAAQVSQKAVTLSAELPSKSDWEDSLVTCIEDVPFHYIGKGEQSLIKTKLALNSKRAKKASTILLEEPENHLTHANLSALLEHVASGQQGKQVIVSTHSSFVANKLGLDSLILLNDGKSTRTNDLHPETKKFFEKIAGYDTLRLILANKAILVEGPSDELIVQKAYAARNGGKLPIHNGVDVISVGSSFLRFLELADKIGQSVAVVTDNDGDVPALEKKYDRYLGSNAKPHIKIYYDSAMDSGQLTARGKPFNYNTLEPKLLKENSLALMNTIFGAKYTTEDEMHLHMRTNKTDCALMIFSTTTTINFPDYVVRAVT